MGFYGLHWIDIGIILLYLLGMLYIGKRLSRNIRDETDFYLAGRKLGKFTQFFLIFGGMTEASSAASVTSVVFKQGASGVWLHLQLIFVTPFYWFFNVWLRRVRLITVGDIFIDRFNSRLLAGIYAFYGIMITTVFVGFGYLASAKTLQAVLVKPESSYTAQDREMIEAFNEFNHLKSLYSKNQLPPEQADRFATLTSMYQKGSIKGYVSYIPDTPILFYVIYGTTISLYVISGGFGAAAITNIFQGFLIIIFSVILIPAGIMKLGGMEGFRETVPQHMLSVVSTVNLGEFNLYSILAMTFIMTIGYCGGTSVMSTSGSAKDELSARLGVVTGAFAKRVMTIAWMVCGLIAVGLFSDQLADPDESWGALTQGLLGVGGIGLMITGILAANMSSMDATSLNISALFVRNIYAPLAPGRSERHYIFVGRLCILGVFIAGILVALNTTGIVALAKANAAINAMFGSVILLIFLWRRLTRSAILYTSILFFLVIVVVPVAVPMFDALRESERLTVRTPERIYTRQREADRRDVEKGLAEKPGDLITTEVVAAPTAIFFEKAAHRDPYDLQSPLVGQGRFHVEIFIASLIGVPVERFSEAGLLATRFMVDALLPLSLLIVLSLLTKSNDPDLADRFYVKLKTPVRKTPEEDAAELEKSYADPHRFDHLKLWPGSNWEFTKWNFQDTAGFVLSWVGVGGIFVLLLYILSLIKS